MYKDKEEQKAYQRQWRAERKISFFADKFCSICGTIDNLELDHVNPDAKISHSIWSWSESRRNEELKKCQILCSKHHKEKTVSDKARHYSDKIEQIVSLHNTGQYSVRSLAKLVEVPKSTVFNVIKRNT